MIRTCGEPDCEEILTIINDAAMAYKKTIPPDRWHEPYMTREQLQAEIKAGVQFSCYVDENQMIGVMGVQDKGDVKLIRHAYVRTTQRRKGIGSILIQTLINDTSKPILIGTWKAATWAIRFYERHGFQLVSDDEKNRLLKKYWTIPDRQIETSVVLADRKFRR